MNSVSTFSFLITSRLLVFTSIHLPYHNKKQRSALLGWFFSPRHPHVLKFCSTKHMSRAFERSMLAFLAFIFHCYLWALWTLFAAWKLSILFFNQINLTTRKLMSLARSAKLHKPTVLIVGGGYAGAYAAKHLSEFYHVILLDTKDYFEFTPSKLRTLVEPDHTKLVQIKFADFLHKTHVLLDRVIQVTPHAAIGEVSGPVGYDYLILCSGSRYTIPRFAPAPTGDPEILHRGETSPRPSNAGDRQPGRVSNDEVYNYSINNVYHRSATVILSARVQQFSKFHQVVLTSNKIIVVGGGTVGVELAAEIVENFPEKDVTIVHSQDQLMNRSPQHAIRYTERWFKKKGVRVLLGERVIGHEGLTFKTKKGTVLEADLAFFCTGNTPNSDYLRNPSFIDALNGYGFIKVNKHLQLQGYENIFVAGDITDIPEEEEKLCQTAGAEIKVVVSNIHASQAGKPLQLYVPSRCPMLISLGKYDGILTYRGYTLTGFVPALMKEFVEWKEMIHYWNWSRFVKISGTRRPDIPFDHHAHMV